jgi:Ca2+-binding RTX toxin-like protein
VISGGTTAAARLRWIAAFSLLLLAVSAAPVLAGPGLQGADGGPAAEPLPSPAEFSRALARSEREAEERAEAREAELATPEAEREREASREAYASLTDAEAQSLLVEAFDEELAELDSDAARVVGGLRIEKVLGPNVARVGNAEGGTELVESSIPIETAGPGEDPAQVDLMLERDGGSFVPHNPLVEVRLPASASGAIQLPSGVEVAGLAGEGNPDAHRLGEEDLFFPGTDTATDTLVSPVTGGVEIFEQLRSPESPEQFSYELSLPQGATLRATSQGGAEVVDSSGAVLVTVPPPSAVDAQGTEVPVELGVKGSSLLVDAPHRSVDIAYPVLVDPELVENVGPGTSGFGFWTPVQSAENAGYELSSGGCLGTCFGPGLYARSRGNETLYRARSWGQFVFQSPGATAYVNRAIFSSVNLNIAANCSTEQQPHGFVGVFNVVTGIFEPQRIFLRPSEANNASFDTFPRGAPNIRHAVVGVGASSSDVRPRCAHDFFVGGATLFFEDPEAPTLGAPSGPGQPVGDTAVPITISAGDPGFGVAVITAQTEGADGQTKIWNVFPGGGCTGLRASPCPASVSNVSVTYDPAVMPEGSRTLTITARDSAGHVSAPRFATVNVDHTDPDTAIDTGPADNSAIAGITTTFTYHSTEQGAGFECELDFDGFAPCPGNGFTTPALSDGTHTFSVRARDQAGNVDPSPPTRTFTVGAPETTITSGPSENQAIGGNTTSFFYKSSKPNSTFECRLDSGKFASCSELFFTTPALSDGVHTFSVRAKSAAGVVDPSPATRTFIVGAPDTSILSGPSQGSSITTKTTTFTYESSKPNSTFECKLDSGSFATCPNSGFTTPTLSPGDHTFSVRAISSIGLTDPSPATRAFIFDPGPQTRIDSGPEDDTDQRPRFTYSSNDPAATFECRFEFEAFKPCPAEGFEPEAPLNDGAYTFSVRAVDQAGNRDLTPASRGFFVNVEGPLIEIEDGPEGLTGNTTPKFVWFAPEEPRVECAIDPPGAEPNFGLCNGPTPRGIEPTEHRVVTPLADGPYTFRVKGTDHSDNTTTAERSFVVNTSAPQTTIDSGPAGAVSRTSVNFEYSSDLPSTFQCRLDDASFTQCSNFGLTLNGLSEGQHQFEVRAINGASIPDSTPARRSFIVDTSSPSLPAVSGPAREPGVPGLTLRLVVKDGDPSSPATIRSGVGAIRVRVDGQLVETLPAECALNVCPASAVRNVQMPVQAVIGTHRYAVEGEDGVGHFSELATWEETTPVAGTAYFARASGPTDCLARAKPLNTKPINGVLTGTNRSDLLKGGRGIKKISGEGGCDVIIGGPAEEKIEGGDGNDLIRSRRSNDKVFGEDGNDTLYGGIGDDNLRGGPGSDLVDGGPGADVERGEAGGDTLRGGQGEDQLSGGGGAGTDTLSYADLIPPGFEGELEPNFEGFPGSEAGVVIDLGAARPNAVDFLGTAGDALFIEKKKTRKPSEAEIKEPGGFERIVGSAFNDLIVGTAGAETIVGGPGSDVILGRGGGDPIDGGSGDNYLEGQPARPMQQPLGKIELGLSDGDQGGERNLFVSGSTGNDAVTVNYREDANTVQFIAGSTAIAESFLVRGCKNRPPARLTVNCPLGGEKLGAVALFGGGGDDTIRIGEQSPERPGAFVLGGGNGTDTLQGSALEDLLDDGRVQEAGTEHLRGGGGDDVIFQGVGADEVVGGGDNDLLISSKICEGDTIFGDVRGKGDTGSDNGQFHPVQVVGVFADLEASDVGEAVNGEGKCGGEKPETLAQFNDLEGSPQADFFRGNEDHNLLIGRGGADTLLSRAGPDVINAKDLAIDAKIDCGAGADTGRFDADVGGKSERGLLENCEEKTPLGTAFVSTARGSLLADEESEPPSLGAVAESLTPPAPPITAYFGLDDTEGTAAENSIEGEPSGTYEAAGVGPAVNGPGPILGAATALLSEEGSAVTLDGSADHVDLAGQGAPGGADGYSVALFVKFAKQPGQREFLFSSAEGDKGAFLYREPDGRIVFAAGLAVGAPRVTSAEPVNDDRWHQVVGSMEGEEIVLNLDGFSVELGYGQGVLPQLSSPQTLLGAGPGRTGFLAGTVDELVTFEGRLSEAEVFAQLAESQAEEPELLPTPPPETSDVDGDGLTDGVDNCPEISNPGQQDLDLNGVGDACEPVDSDGDGVSDPGDNCPTAYNPEQTDDDADGIGNECALLPPAATTETAAEVQDASATLRATVNPGGTATTYQFEYGTTTEYGEVAPVTPEEIGSGAAPVAVSEAIGGLQPGTTYHYRVVATNAAGETEGADETFTTSRAPTAATDPATAVRATSATFNAKVNPGGGQTTYQFEYGKTTSYGSTVPATPKSIGSGAADVAVSEAVTGLEASTIYHYRVRAVNQAGTTLGQDRVFRTEAPPVTPGQLAGMRTTELFNGQAASTTRFNADWSALGWASGATPKGEAANPGWRPVSAFPTPNGAFFEAPLTDTGSGVAVAAFMPTNPGTPERYFSLWLDMPSPASPTRTGYELRFTLVSTNTYTVALSRWQAGVRTVLASQANVTLLNSTAFALLDQGETVSAWANAGSGFTQLLSAGDGSFAAGHAGLEGAGNFTRLTNFKTGVPLAPVANIDAALKGLELNDPFTSNESPLSGDGGWAPLAWAGGGNTGQVQDGWGPFDPFPTVNGAFWQRAAFADTGAGAAVAATLLDQPTLAGRHFSLWLHMPDPASARSGYELRFTESSAGSYDVELSRWEGGTRTVLTTKTAQPFPVGGQLALVDKGGSVSALTNAGSGFTQLLSVADTTFSAGYTGIEGSGNVTRLGNFRSGPLPPF